MIENSTNRMDTSFIQTRTKALRKNTDPRMKGQMILGESLTVAFMAKKSLSLSQMWPVGFTILELSKAHMFELFYRVIRPVFYGRASVILSDTDSFILALPARDTSEALEKLKEVMDFSNYDSSHRLYQAGRKNVPGYLKNEVPDREIVEVVGVRSKTYAYRTEDNNYESRCKGVKKQVRKKIPFQQFRDTVVNPDADSKEPARKLVEVTQYVIQSKTHLNRLMQVRKTAMTSFCDKRNLAECGRHSFPYGSRLIELSKEMGMCFYCANPHIFS